MANHQQINPQQKPARETNPIRLLFDLDKNELNIVLMSAGYGFLLLCAYYVLRPVRETMGIARSADDLPLLFLGTMAATLLLAPFIGALVSKYRRGDFIPMVYRFIISNLIIFFLLLKTLPEPHLFYVGVVFYIWLTVFNLLLISLFWGFMSDGLSFDDSKRLFPVIAIGATLGAILGSGIAKQFIALIGQGYLLLVSAVLLELAARLMKRIDLKFQSRQQSNTATSQGEINLGNEHCTKACQPANLTKPTNPTNDSNQSNLSKWLSGISYACSSPYLLAIAAYIFFYGITSTFLYFQQGQLVAEATQASAQRTQIFANIDLWTNILTLALQLFITRQILTRLGIGTILMGLPIVTLIGFIFLGLYPTLAVLLVFQASRRALNYGLFKPAREILFTLIEKDQKYKAKSFVDTFFYRGGDAVGAVTQKALIAFQLTTVSMAFLVAPIAAIWALLSIYLGIQAKHKNQIMKSSNTDLGK